MQQARLGGDDSVHDEDSAMDDKDAEELKELESDDDAETKPNSRQPKGKVNRQPSFI